MREEVLLYPKGNERDVENECGDGNAPSCRNVD